MIMTVYECLCMFTKCLQMFSNVYVYLQTNKKLPMCINVYKCLPMF